LSSISLTFLIDIALNENFGIIKALRIAQECKANIVSLDSNRNTISLSLKDPTYDDIKCLSRIDGYVSIEPRIIINLCNHKVDLFSLLRNANLNYKRFSSLGRLICFIELKKGVVAIWKTSKECIFLGRYLNTKRVSPPISPSSYTVIGRWTEVLSIINTLLTDLNEFIQQIVSYL